MEPYRQRTRTAFDIGNGPTNPALIVQQLQQSGRSLRTKSGPSRPDWGEGPDFGSPEGLLSLAEGLEEKIYISRFPYQFSFVIHNIIGF